MSQSNCTPLCQIEARLWVSILSEKIGGSPTLNLFPRSESYKVYRSGFQWISDYSYITSDDMIVGGRLSKPSEMTFVETLFIVQESNFNDLKTIQIYYLIPGANSC